METKTISSIPTVPKLQGSWLFFTHTLWIILTTIAIGILIASMLALYLGRQKPCIVNSSNYVAGCFSVEQANQQFGLSPNFYVGYSSVGVMLEVLPWILMGILVFSRKPREPFMLLFSIMLVISGTVAIDINILGIVLSSYPSLSPLLKFMAFIGSSLVAVWYLFPDGRLVFKWMRWASILWVIRNFIVFCVPYSSFNYAFWPERIAVLFASSLVYSLFYRYRYIPDQTQRQQIKWVAVSTSFFALIYSIGFFLPYQLGIPEAIIQQTYRPIFNLGGVLVVVSLGFSILRYRLWDIDFIINRSLVYGALTTLLAALFGGSLLIVSQLFQNFSGGPLVAVAVSAAVFGGIFQPTRRQIQRFVDQRFYNIQIDYQKTPPDLLTLNPTTVLHQMHFGAYQNLELIGRGGMAEVYKATNPATGTPVAIKMLPNELASETEFRQRFTREARVVSQLQHPNIVRIFDSGELDGQYYMVMEYLTGNDLDRLIKNNGRLPLAQALPLIQQIASALDYAHTQGFVHRDIKPSNVLLDSNSTRAVLTDFGIAKVNNAHTVMTVTGYMLGTFDYIAPEQIQETSNVDGKADIYALGVMVYQILTGELPFKHNNPGALLIAHLNQPAPNPCEVLADIPYHIGSAIQQAMAKKPEERFGTAKEFVMAMD